MIKPASEVAQLLIENLKLYEQEKEKTVPYFRVSRNSISRITGHGSYLPPCYAQVLGFEMQAHGFVPCYPDNATIGFMNINSISNWLTIGTGRIEARHKDEMACCTTCLSLNAPELMDGQICKDCSKQGKL